MWCVDYEKAKLKRFGWTVVIPLSLTREPHMSSTRRSLGLALFFFFLWDFSISRSYSLFLGFSHKLLYSLIRKQIKNKGPTAQSVVAKTRKKKLSKYSMERYPLVCTLRAVRQQLAYLYTDEWRWRRRWLVSQGLTCLAACLDRRRRWLGSRGLPYLAAC